jgi:hypothetical protein
VAAVLIHVDNRTDGHEEYNNSLSRLC